MDWETVGLVITVSAGTIIGSFLYNHFSKKGDKRRPAWQAALSGFATAILAAIIYTAPNWIAQLAG
ncbi:MAG: hypothetical protein LBN97_10005 [Oscillospiraceae bacterium]|jgi:membrane associated rhomboid family serine protease|nr:hypothetical protein [Oscillospiraceae bacterium]